MDLSKTLAGVFAKVKQLRDLSKQVRALQAKERKPKRRLRLPRSRWIAESQKQGVEVALDRANARKTGTMAAHLKRFYPAHNHGKAVA